MVGFFPQDTSATNQVIGFRNRVINGAMRIDQRNVGNALSIATSSGAYTLDRFYWSNGLANPITVQQIVLGASGVPPRLPITNQNTNHTHALLWTNSSTATSSTTVTSFLQYGIEANNCVDFGWGNSVPKTVTVSFWVYASSAGTYSFSLYNSTGSAYYVTSYSIQSASTWQLIKLIIPGPTIGTWTSDTSSLCLMMWGNHGSTSSSATASLNTWTTSQTFIASTQTNLGATASSTFAITGVQLEIGTLATLFEWRPSDLETRMCQRYYEKSCAANTLPVSTEPNGSKTVASISTFYLGGVDYQIEKRVAPTIRLWNSQSGSAAAVGQVNVFLAKDVVAATPGQISSKRFSYINNGNGAFSSNTSYQFHYDASSDF